MQYKIKWLGYTASQSTWEPYLTNLHLQGLVDRFEERGAAKSYDAGVSSSGQTGLPLPHRKRIRAEEREKVIASMEEANRKKAQAETKTGPRSRYVPPSVCFLKKIFT